MDWLTTGSEAAGNLGWLIGTTGGVIIDIALVAAVCIAPRLREHGGRPVAAGRTERMVAWIPGLLVAIVWLVGFYYVGLSLLPYYAKQSAIAATVVISLVMLIGFPLAGSQIARRSIW